jgi:hypothetical protein
MVTHNKEKIKDGMVKTAARLWGVQDNEVESSFDPLVLLMIEACAAELEKIGYEINASHTRLIDRLAGLLLPEATMGTKPAYCVVQTQPVEPKLTIDSSRFFYTSQSLVKDISSKNQGNTDVVFSPAGSFNVLKTELLFQFSGNNLFKINEKGKRELLHSSTSGAASANQFWLALSADAELTDLTGLHLFFDVQSNSEKKAFYHSLENAKGWLNVSPVVLQKGYFNNDQFELDPGEMIASGADYSKNINRQVAFVFQDRFISIKQMEPLALAQSTFPEAWESLPLPVQQQVKAAKCIFLKIELDRYFSQDVFDGVNCFINAFPVVNKKLSSFSYQTDDWVNIIPLPVEGLFFDLDKIQNEKGGQYKFRTSAQAADIVAGEALIRSTGIGKTSSREVREMTSALTEAVRDQSAYFGEVSNEFILSRLREIGQIFTRLEDNINSATDNQAVHSYVLLKPKQSGENVTVNYWTTNGTDAHQIKPGTVLMPFNHALVITKKTTIITNVTGGRNVVTDWEKKNILKQQLMSGGKIISAEDVKLLCIQLFGEKLKKVNVSKGVKTGTKKEEGFIRTIDVELTIHTKHKATDNDEIESLRRELEYLLSSNASMVYPFNVIIKEEN